jgi:hypothetical protein
MLYQFH